MTAVRDSVVAASHTGATMLLVTRYAAGVVEANGSAIVTTRGANLKSARGVGLLGVLRGSFAKGDSL